jgi:hypothetical protein
MPVQPSLFADVPSPPVSSDPDSFARDLAAFQWEGKPTIVATTPRTVGGHTMQVPTYVNEFWTSRQRAAHSLHEISYRACFKPQLPRFFIERLTNAGDTVYDPFMGRGTTVLEAALLSRVPIGCDINPLSAMLVGPRLRPPAMDAVRARLADIDWNAVGEYPEDLLAFYHPDTLRELSALRTHLLTPRHGGRLDEIDAWIRMVAVNRLTGHSPGFFSVYTLPPNQAVSTASQRKINAARNQVPPRRSVPGLIVRKSRSLLADADARTREILAGHVRGLQLVTGPAAATPAIAASSVSLVVTSPPFLDVVDYAGDNWLRCWFCGIDPATVPLTILRKIDDWQRAMAQVFAELARVLKPGGHVAFEVGEVRGGSVHLDDHVIPCGASAGLEPLLVVINAQAFTKTAACWGVDNNRKGTNTNRIVLFRKP